MSRVGIVISLLFGAMACGGGDELPEDDPSRAGGPNGHGAAGSGSSSSNPEEAPLVFQGPVPGALVGMPFPGALNRFAGTGDDTSPVIHHRVMGGNWATDLYAPPDTAVRFRQLTGAVATVAALGSACSGGGPDMGGWYIRIDLTSAIDGAALGSVFYLHVAEPTVSVGQVLPGSFVLGTTRKWGWSSCYQVSTDSGVHIHFESRSAVGSSCYVTTGGSTDLKQGFPIARLGAGDSVTYCPDDLTQPPG